MYFVFFFQAEDGIRDAQESRGLGDVYKRQATAWAIAAASAGTGGSRRRTVSLVRSRDQANRVLSLIHI